MTKKELFLKKLGKRIADLRDKAGITQAELALRCDKDRQSLNRLEKGKANVTAHYLFDLAAELKVSVKDFFDFE